MGEIQGRVDAEGFEEGAAPGSGAEGDLGGVVGDGAGGGVGGHADDAIAVSIPL